MLDSSGARDAWRPSLVNLKRVASGALLLKRGSGGPDDLNVSITVPVLRPQLPTTVELLPFLERIDSARYYSNHGQLLREFEGELAKIFGFASPHLSVVANGTVALSAALLAAEAPAGSKCLLPSWTFVASAAAAWAANLRPHFADVSAETWALDPDAVRRRKDLDEIGAVIAVSPFGAPLETKPWDEFTAETGIPVIIDAAAGFDSASSVPSFRPGSSPVMISLHATKVLGVGEGGLVMSSDESLMRRFNKVCNFGLWDQTGGQILGYNGKLSEYHAAVGLAALKGWPKRRNQIEFLTSRYVDALSNIAGVTTVPGYNAGWVSCYCNVSVDVPAAHVISRLAERGIETRRWWKSGVHTQTAYARFSRDELPITEYLAQHTFGLPFFHDMTDEQLDHVITSLEEVLLETHGRHTVGLA